MREISLADGVRLTPPRVKEGLSRGAKAHLEVERHLPRGDGTKVETTWLWRRDLEDLRDWIDEALQ